MSRYLSILLILITLGFTASCSTNYRVTSKSKRAPGQIKKITGSKSARPYAHGQQKNKKYKKGKKRKNVLTFVVQ